MSDRPYIRHRIDELETFFAESSGDASVLQQLETELSFRQVPRAVTLLAKVRAAQQDGMPEPAAVQHTLFSGETKTATQPAAYSAPPSQSEVAPAKPEPAPTMSLLDAYKVLKVPMDSAWEVIENSRRQIVQRSSPTHLTRMTEEKRAPILTEAKLANAAYAVILKSRTECDNRLLHAKLHEFYLQNALQEHASSAPATLALSGSPLWATLTASLRRRPLRTVTMTPGRHTTPLEVEPPPPWMVTMLSWTASIASDMDLENEFQTPEP